MKLKIVKCQHAIFYVFIIYIKSVPDEVIPGEYFFKVRKPNIRRKRKLKEEAKKAKKMNIEI